MCISADGCRPFYDGNTDPCTNDPGKNPKSCWTNTTMVPASVDWVSCDSYQDPTVDSSPWPWDPSSTIPEPMAKQYFAERFMYSKLHPHQKVSTHKAKLPPLSANKAKAFVCRLCNFQGCSATDLMSGQIRFYCKKCRATGHGQLQIHGL